ncbi:MAG: HNH endonuclease [Candidatus Omnitrophica bacterium]|nr:HNH endonuclease [Candidatus Omnitrophota bacterium]
MRNIGKKTREWLAARKELLKLLKKEGYYIHGDIIRGWCCDCGRYSILDPDHIIKRSRGGSHERENIELPCRRCHDKRDNQGDPMNKKPANKKASWQIKHKCKNCKVMTSQYLCHNCQKASI